MSTIQTTQEVINLVKENIAPITEALKNGGEYGFELLVRKAYLIDGILSSIFFGITSVISFIILLLSEDAITLIMFMVFLTLSFFFASSLGYIILPEYYAIIEAINFIK